jgi:hypothetical protein
MQSVNVTGRTNEEERSSIWQSVSLEDLAQEQGAQVVSDIDSITALWPADDDPDALLDFVHRHRGERRKAEAQGVA